MRRLTFAAVCGTLVLAACSDQTPTEPTAPPAPEQSVTACRPATHFPIVQVTGLILKVFPKGKLQLEALVRAAAVALFWETCRKTAAQRGAIDFVSFMYANSSKLTGTQTQQTTLVNLMLGGTEVPFTVPTVSPNDFGVGVFDPASKTNTLVKTRSGVAFIDLEPGSFEELTFIKVERKSDNQKLTGFDGEQFAPTIDYDALNASGDHVLKNGKKALIGFCLLDEQFVIYPPNRRTGHNPVEGAPRFPFEILEDVDLATERPDLYAALLASCPALQPNLSNPTLFIGGFGQGLPELANAAWRTARYYLAPVQTLLLPEALHAATLAVATTLPPPGNRLPSLSPVRSVKPISTSTSLTSSSALAIVGQGPTLTATVSPAPPATPVGQVEFFDGTTSLGTASLNSGGVAVFTASSLSLAQHSLTAHFLGTPTHVASTSSALVQNMVERFDLSTFADAVGGAEPYSTQNFSGFDNGTLISTIIDGVLTVTSPFDQLLVSGTEKFLFGSDNEGNPTRTAGNGKYDLAFTAPVTNNALAFDVMAENPSAGPATVVVSVGAGSATFSVPNTSGNETTPVFLGIIASAPFSSVEVIEGPEIPTIISEEIGLDNFQVGTVSLPLSF